MQRRKFLQLTAVGGTVMLVTGISCNSGHPSADEILGKPELLAQICDLKTLKEIGMAYRMQTVSETEADKLTTLLLTDSAGKPVSATSDSSAIQSTINRKIARDFETGNIVIVNGWVLAVTEARQCALLYLNNS